MSLPIIFVETNFIISLLFPHVDYNKYEQAHALLAENGTSCRIEIPAHSIFESVSTVQKKAGSLKKDFVERKKANYDNGKSLP